MTVRFLLEIAAKARKCNLQRFVKDAQGGKDIQPSLLVCEDDNNSDEATFKLKKNNKKNQDYSFIHNNLIKKGYQHKRDKKGDDFYFNDKFAVTAVKNDYDQDGNHTFYVHDINKVKSK
jgi:hypothetical protein